MPLSRASTRGRYSRIEGVTKGEAGRPLLGAPGGGVLLLVGVGLPSFLLLLRGGKEGEEEKERGAPPPLPVQFGPEGEGRAAYPRPALSLSTNAHKAHYFSGGFPVTLRHSGFLRNHPEHFRCPNIVVQYIDLYVSTISSLLVMSVHIRDSELPSVHQNTKTHNTDRH